MVIATSRKLHSGIISMSQCQQLKKKILSPSNIDTPTSIASLYSFYKTHQGLTIVSHTPAWIEYSIPSGYQPSIQ